MSPASELYPLVFEPIFKERVWGGRRLQSRLGKVLPGEGPVGESWELCDLPDPDQSRVASGPLAGIRLGELVQRDAPSLMGPAQLDLGSFPLLVKYIDASQTLSVQVHPDAGAAAALGGRPKSEAWYVLDAEPGAAIYLGLCPGTGPEELRRAIQTGQVGDLVERIPARAGSLVPVPPGTVHAIGGGIMLAEVQQPSDTTYRVFDWGRVGLDGRPRQLHVEQALGSIDWLAAPEVRAAGSPRSVEMGVFRIDEIIAGGAHPSGADLGGEGPAVLVGLEGSAQVEARGAAPTPCGLGTVALLPHVCRQRSMRLEALGAARALLVTFAVSDSGNPG